MISVLVVDDSSFMRKAITHILESDKGIRVMDYASNGEEAVRKVKDLHPDVVLLDIEMPLMDGLTALSRIMAECPAPVLMLSGLDNRHPAIVLKSLNLGAVDYISKPSGVISYDIDNLREEMITRTHIASTARVKKIPMSAPEQSFELHKRKTASLKKLVVIGASTGGPKAIARVLSGIPHYVSASILVVQHMTNDFIPHFAEQLKWNSHFEVSVAVDGEPLTPGKALLAPGGRNTTVSQDRKIALSREPVRIPSIDQAMISAAAAYGEDVLGVIMTGMGSDGAEGLKAIKEAGGSTMAEDESTCVIFGMPRAAIKLGCVDKIVPLDQIAAKIAKMI
jgi:two-component system, chemotaxis family, protein-glutamate methylesterase/glutaminase